MFFKIIMLLAVPALALAHEPKEIESLQLKQTGHEMQHGFILSANDSFGSHLVATGHHSRQTEILGELVVPDSNEQEFYQERKKLNSNNANYFLFQAQKLDIISLAEGQLLSGHIIESQVGKYEPKNIVVKAAQFKVKKILLNIENPFFKE